MNVNLNKPLLSLIVMTGITTAFFCGVGAALMITDAKNDVDAPKDTAALAVIAMTSTIEEPGVACSVGDKMWQPAVWNARRSEDTRFTVRF